MTSYTKARASDPALHRSRTTVKVSLMNLFPSSRLYDKFLGYVSIVTGVILMLFILGGCILLLPFIIVDFRRRPSGDNKNISTIGGGSRSAIKTLSARSQMYVQRSGGPDHLAPLLTNQISLFGDNRFATYWFSRMYLFLARCNFYLTGRIFADQLAVHLMKIGETAYLQGRTCWLDDCVETFVREHQDDKTGKANVNVVILGAGYDTRCYRLNLADRGVTTFEVDTAATQTAKIKSLSDAGIDVGQTKSVSCDFTNEDWLERLKSNGFDDTTPTMFVWEGVTPYLPREAVKATIEKVGTCARGSCIGFDYLDRTWALTPKMDKYTKRGGEPWLFGMTGSEPEELIVECSNASKSNLSVWDHLEYKEVIERYMPKHCDGRPIGYLDDFGGFLLAGTT